MTSRGFRKGTADRIAGVLSRSVDAGRMPGAVFGVSRRGETHVESVGTVAVGGGAMPRQALFRITSMTRPITALATLILVNRGLISLDGPVDDMLPELADQRVLRRPDGPLDDTVAARRAITTRDLLTMRGGFGMILTPPDEYPILQAEAELGLRSVGPPFPATEHPPDEWIRRMGTLPLMDQPGQQWRYCTGSMILGVLVARAAGQALESFYRDAIFEPLAMHDTTFFAALDDPRVVPPCYQHIDGSLVPFDDEETWRHRRPFPDGGAGLLSTVGDYLRFGSALLANGTDEAEQLLSRDLVARMTTDQLTADQRATAGPILDNRGWGFGLSSLTAPDGRRGPKGYGWDGGFGTFWCNDPDDDLTAVLCTQVLFSEASYALEADFWDVIYAGLDN